VVSGKKGVQRGTETSSLYCSDWPQENTNRESKKEEKERERMGLESEYLGEESEAEISCLYIKIS
jgi:hypothetical protein